MKEKSVLLNPQFPLNPTYQRIPQLGGLFGSPNNPYSPSEKEDMPLDPEKYPELTVAGLHSGAQRIQRKMQAWKKASDRLAELAGSHDRLLVAKGKGLEKVTVAFFSKKSNTGSTVSIEFDMPEIIEELIEYNLNLLRDMVKEFTNQLDEGIKDLENDDN